MRRQLPRWVQNVTLLAIFLSVPVFGRVKLSKLAEQLLYGDESTRMNAVNEFNHMPSEAQQKMVPDFMVAMSEDDPKTRRIASKILKAMGVQVRTEVPDARKELHASTSTAKSGPADPWAEEKKLKAELGQDKWGDLKKMKSEETGTYEKMKSELDNEKKSAFLDATELTSDRGANASPITAVVDSLKDPNPWVRAQAARRVGTLHPAPVEAIPVLITMLGENIPESRRAAAAALGSFGPLATQAIPALTTALSDPDSATKVIAQDALKQIQQK